LFQLYPCNTLTPPSIEGHPKALKVLALAADLILIPSRPGISDMESVEKWAKLMVQYNRPSMIVLNAIKKRTNRILTARRRLSKAGDLCPVEIPDFDDFLTAGEAGLGVVEIKGAKGADDIDALWAIVRRRIEI
jgi:chromosome partitioning protein